MTTTTEPKYTDDDYLSEEWWQDRDVRIRCRKKRMVTTSAEHTCPGNGQGEAHPIPKGTRALYETCIYDGEWVKCWLCTACMDAWLDKINGEMDEDED